MFAWDFFLRSVAELQVYLEIAWVLSFQWEFKVQKDSWCPNVVGPILGELARVFELIVIQLKSGSGHVGHRCAQRTQISPSNRVKKFCCKLVKLAVCNEL
jgi:hypothetical protein